MSEGMDDGLEKDSTLAMVEELWLSCDKYNEKWETNQEVTTVTFLYLLKTGSSQKS